MNNLASRATRCDTTEMMIDNVPYWTPAVLKISIVDKDCLVFNLHSTKGIQEFAMNAATLKDFIAFLQEGENPKP